MPSTNRRQFLIQTAAAWSATRGTRLAFGQEFTPPSADRLVPGKDSRLIVRNATPFEFETPLDLLAESSLTPVKYLFIRNNQSPANSATLAPMATKDWPVEVSGLVDRPRVVAFDRLKELPTVETEMVLQCSGNGRAHFSRAAHASGAQWQDGAIGNVRFGGVRLRALIDSLGVKIDPRAKYLTAEGRDAPAAADTADFEHSLPLTDALDRSILATTLNGQPLAAVHGGPLRLVTPGYYGTMHVKWLSRLRLDAEESSNYHHVERYRTPLVPIAPGETFKYRADNSEPNWRMKIKSLLFAPHDGQSLRSGEVNFRGVAWNDGAAKIEAVELSLDDGRTWSAATLDEAASPYAWHPWHASLRLRPGRHTALCRAVDALGRTQPLDGAIHWNPSGYAWNGVQHVSFSVT